MSIDAFFLNKVKDQVKPVYSKLKHWEHGWLHIEHVNHNAILLANKENVDPVLCSLAAYCHDLGRVEEAERGFIDNSLEGARDHARLSVQPTIKIMNQLGVTGDDFDYILEAVMIHSYFNYDGKNPVAKILRDSDKCNAFGPFGALRVFQFNLKENSGINPTEVYTSYGNYDKLNSLVNKTLMHINSSSENVKTAINGLGKVLEWVDNDMFHCKSAYNIFKSDIEYTQKVNDFLLENK